MEHHPKPFDKIQTCMLQPSTLYQEASMSGDYQSVLEYTALAQGLRRHKSRFPLPAHDALDEFVLTCEQSARDARDKNTEFTCILHLMDCNAQVGYALRDVWDHVPEDILAFLEKIDQDLLEAYDRTDTSSAPRGTASGTMPQCRHDGLG